MTQKLRGEGDVRSGEMARQHRERRKKRVRHLLRASRQTGSQIYAIPVRAEVHTKRGGLFSDLRRCSKICSKICNKFHSQFASSLTRL